jgi:hypothetical protein
MCRSKVLALGLVLVACLVYSAPLLALGLVSGGGGACSCQNPQPPGDPLAVVAFLDASQGWPCAGVPHVLRAGDHTEAMACGALRPLGFLFPLTTESRPPPLYA